MRLGLLWYVILIVLYVHPAKSFDYVNVALGKPARQKDLWSSEPSYPEFAVDGNRNPSFPGQSCTHTGTDTNTWWTVDLLGEYTIHAVTITNRVSASYRLAGFTIYLSDENPLNYANFPSSIPGKTCLSRQNEIPSAATVTIPCSPNVKGRYLIVYKPANDYLTICELEALATRNLKMLDFRLYQNVRSSKEPFYTITNVSSSGRCLRNCLQAPDGWTTAVQYRSSDGQCECVQISGFDNPVPGTAGVFGWTLYVAKSN